MSTPTHTPGPWFRGCDSPHGVQIVTMNQSGDANACLATIHHSTITPGIETSDEVKANARLIAAAPELLAALREVERLAAVELWDTGVMKPVFGRALAAARAAIAKAMNSLTVPEVKQ